MPSIHLQIGSAIVALSTLTGAGSAPRCEQVAGWQHASDQRPSPFPYSELERNHAVQLDDRHWSWNGDRISGENFFHYLERVAKLVPQPIMLVKFWDKGDCQEIRALKVRIAVAANCSADGPLCLEGTNAEYVAARFKR